MLFLRRMPADRGCIKRYLRPVQRSEPRALGIPLVPADQRSYAPNLRVESLEPEIARGEIKFFVTKWSIRNVHLAINATQPAVSINHHCRIVIHARCAPLKQRCDQYDP